MTSRTLGEEGQQLSPKSQPASPPASLGRWRPRSSCPGVTPLPPPPKNNAHRQPCPIPTSDQDPAAVIWVCCRIGFTFVAVFRGARRGEGALRLLEEGGREGPLRALALPALPVLGDSGSLCVRMAPNVHFVCFPEHRKGEDNNNNEKKKEKEKERKERRRGVEKKRQNGDRTPTVQPLRPARREASGKGDCPGGAAAAAARGSAAIREWRAGREAEGLVQDPAGAAARPPRQRPRPLSTSSVPSLAIRERAAQLRNAAAPACS